MIKIIYLALVIILVSFIRANSQTINPPSNLEAESEDSSYIKVKWDDNSFNEEGFFVERAQVLDTSSWEVIDVVPQNSEIYFDYWVTRGMKYYYRVFAYNGTIHSGYSNVDSAILLGDPYVIPAAPTDLQVKNITQTSVTIQWTDNAQNEIGFVVARRGQNDLFFHYIDTVAADILTYQEVGLTPDNSYFYKVCSFNEFGISDYSNVVLARTKQSTIVITGTVDIPENYFLGHNYPNPFNPETSIKFGLSKNSSVKLKVYNSLGEEIETLLSQNLSAGTYSVRWNARNFTSGIYFYSLETEDFKDIKKMILIK